MHPQFKHILLPLDFTEKNEAALDIALGLATEHSAQVSLIHVIEQFATADPELDDFYERMLGRASQELELRAGRFLNAGLTVVWTAEVGRRASEIIRHANEQAVDLIVLSSHVVDPNDPRKSWGTLSYQVSVLSECPVLLVK